MKKVVENRNHLATKQQIINTSVILRDFLQENSIAVNDMYRFLRKKKLSVLGLEKAKNQFINYSIYGKETELVKEFFEEVK
jgi:hypothetical protein